MHFIIYAIAFLEWFTTLSVEIVALRKFTPIIWSSSISTSIILWVILLALSYWYYKWGQISAQWKKIESILVRNLLIASAYYFFITFIFTEVTLQSILSLSGNYFFAILVASIILFFIPVFLASQTIPLLSELLKWKHSWEKMWKLLFYSTIWSFLGSVGTSSFLFPLIWVIKTAVISPLILVICSVLIMYYTKFYKKVFCVVAVFLFSFYISILAIDIKADGYVYHSSNAYHDIHIYDDDLWRRIFSLDGAFSSGINLDDKKSFFNYIQEVEKLVEEQKPKNILVIWAAGFTFPRDVSQFDFVENIDVIDVDKDLKEIAEMYLLEEKLSEKINFYAQPARYFLNTIEGKKYDMVFVDAYSGKSLPPQVLTQEFFQQLTEVSEAIYLNIIMDTSLQSTFSQSLLNTLVESFPKAYYKDVWVSKRNYFTNFIVSNKELKGYHQVNVQKADIYTDNKHSIELDLFQLNNNKLK